MKRIFIALMAAFMLTACGNSDNEVAVAETTPTTTTVTTTEATTTISETTTTVVTTTERAKSKTELAEECKNIVISDLNTARRNAGLEELENTYDLDQCAWYLTQEFIADISVYNNGERADGSPYGTVLEDYSLKCNSCMVLYGQTYNYYPENITEYVSDGCGVWNDAAYDSFGFYYDQDYYYWVALLCDMTSGKTAYNSTPYETLITYLEALINDDYEAYLAITLAEDNEETRKDFDYNKEGYVGVDLWDILYYETELNAWYGVSDYDYKVIEFEDDGTYKFDINTFDNAYGIVRINELQSGGYYVWGHVKYTPFFVIN